MDSGGDERAQRGWIGEGETKGARRLRADLERGED